VPLVIDRVGKWPPRTTLLGAAVAVAVLGWVNVWVGWEVSFSVLYLLPISATAWVVGLRSALLLSVAAAAVWMLAGQLAGFPASHPLVPYWNAFVRLTFFVVVSVLLDALRAALAREQNLSRTDPLTGVSNARSFREAVDAEVIRATRTSRPFTLVYLDLDDFKLVNDRLGHDAGDRLLARVAATLTHAVRRSDVVARLGGDEFAMLLPETDADGARAVLAKVLAALEAEMPADQPVTFSAGGIVSPGEVTSVEAVLAAADALMYRIKRTGKAGYEIETLAPTSEALPAR
ncbi:MAG: GGDEF domain-containing protein, partial [Gemmatimonadaceae bacterium]|nr:GGDEF domain-containing protein [Gemmatimonadaceae bacterium]